MEVDNRLAILIIIIATVVYIAWVETYTPEQETTVENKTTVCEDSCTTHWYYNAALKMMMPYTTCDKCNE